MTNTTGGARSQTLPPRERLVERPAKAVPERVEDLADFRPQIDAIRREARALTAGLTDEQFNWQPDPTRWSIAHCLQHLVVSADGLLAAQRRAIEEARQRRMLSDGPYRHGRIGAMIAASIEPPVKRRFKSARAITPSGRHAVDTLLAEFDRRQDQILEVIESARGVDLGKARVALAGLPIIRLSLGQAFAFTVGHERRHLWQAREVREALQSYQLSAISYQ